MRDRDGLFEIEPAGKKQPQGGPAAVDKAFRVFDPHQVLLLPSLDDWLPERASAVSAAVRFQRPTTGACGPRRRSAGVRSGSGHGCGCHARGNR